MSRICLSMRQFPDFARWLCCRAGLRLTEAVEAATVQEEEEEEEEKEEEEEEAEEEEEEEKEAKPRPLDQRWRPSGLRLGQDPTAGMDTGSSLSLTTFDGSRY